MDAVSRVLVSELRSRNFSKFRDLSANVPSALDRLEKYRYLDQYQSDSSVIDAKKIQIVAAVNKILDKVAEKYVFLIFSVLILRFDMLD
jgi:hypothetical protein